MSALRANPQVSVAAFFPFHFHHITLSLSVQAWKQSLSPLVIVEVW